MVPETIYQAVYRPDLGGLSRDLPEKALRTGRRRRKPHRHPDSRRPQPLVDMTMIDARPAEVADRSVPGHWEGDLITGAYNRSAIGTLVERSSRFTILLHLPDGRHTADLVRDALVEAFTQLPAAVRRSLTWDHGKEMALHAQVAGTLEMPVFFCQKASPWQRPSNENTNGLLRQYFPKGTDLRVHSAEQIAAVAAELNTRPRKTLGWQTPAEQLTRHASGWTAGPEMNPSTGTARTTIQDHSQPPRCDDGWNPPIPPVARGFAEDPSTQCRGPWGAGRRLVPRQVVQDCGLSSTRELQVRYPWRWRDNKGSRIHHGDHPPGHSHRSNQYQHSGDREADPSPCTGIQRGGLTWAREAPYTGRLQPGCTA